VTALGSAADSKLNNWAVAPNNRIWVIGRLLTIGAVAILAGNAMALGPRAVEALGLAVAATGISASSVAFFRRRRDAGREMG
jgi:hypothetical protein